MIYHVNIGHQSYDPFFSHLFSIHRESEIKKFEKTNTKFGRI